jgi:hypothetical protein
MSSFTTIAAPRQMLAKLCQFGSSTLPRCCMTSWWWRFLPCTFCIIILWAAGAPFLLSFATVVKPFLLEWNGWYGCELFIPGRVDAHHSLYLAWSMMALDISSYWPVSDALLAMIVLSIPPQLQTFWTSSFIIRPISRLRYVGSIADAQWNLSDFVGLFVPIVSRQGKFHTISHRLEFRLFKWHY